MDIKLSNEQAKFLYMYLGLPEDQQRLVRYLIEIGTKHIFTEDEYGDFLELLKR